MRKSVIKSWLAYTGLKHLWNRTHILLKLKERVYRGSLRSVLLFDCKTLGLVTNTFATWRFSLLEILDGETVWLVCMLGIRFRKTDQNAFYCLVRLNIICVLRSARFRWNERVNSMQVGYLESAIGSEGLSMELPARHTWLLGSGFANNEHLSIILCTIFRSPFGVDEVMWRSAEDVRAWNEKYATNIEKLGSSRLHC